MDKNAKNIVYGFLAWLVPFVASFLLYSPKGEPLYDAQVTHNVLIILGLGLDSFLLVMYFKGISKDYLKEGLIVGIIWLLISSILDIIFLVYLFNMPFFTWVGRIGVSYLAFPILGVSMGMLLDWKMKKR